MAGKRNPRLSLAQCDSVGKASSPQELQEAYSSLIAHFEQQYPSNKVVSVKSRTDSDRQRRRSFADKDQITGKATEGGAPGEDILEFITKKNIGLACRKGMKPEAPNQDSFALLMVEDVFALYGVFDGHGPFGHDISDAARDLLVLTFLQHPEVNSDTKKAFEDSFIKTQEDLKAKFKHTEIAVSGSTCTMAYHDYATAKITIAHIGDSRAVIGLQGTTGTYSTVEELTIDHKPELPGEKSRIESNGGRVEFDGFYNYRVFAKASQSPGLNMSRAFGDVYAHTSAGLTAMPDVRELSLDNYKAGNECITLLLCSDGVWEFIANEQVPDVMKDKISQLDVDRRAQNAADQLATESYKRWMDDSGNEVADDITVVLVELPLK